jgi:hypothetical protein
MSEKYEVGVMSSVRGSANDFTYAFDCATDVSMGYTPCQLSFCYGAATTRVSISTKTAKQSFLHLVPKKILLGEKNM